MTWSFSWSGEARSRAKNGASNARQPSRSRAFQCRKTSALPPFGDGQLSCKRLALAFDVMHA
eukprot:5540838-Pleurochrysis_carterae.AAC.1